MSSCTQVRKVIHIETGEILSVIQLDPDDAHTAILKGEDGQPVKYPVDLLVCSTCKSEVYAAGLDIFFCESKLDSTYAQTGRLDKLEEFLPRRGIK